MLYLRKGKVAIIIMEIAFTLKKKAETTDIKINILMQERSDISLCV